MGKNVSIFIIKRFVVTNCMMLMYHKVQITSLAVSWIHVFTSMTQNIVDGKLVSWAMQFEDLLNVL